jgi:hypothetical protein
VRPARAGIAPVNPAPHQVEALKRRCRHLPGRAERVRSPRTRPSVINRLGWLGLPDLRMDATEDFRRRRFALVVQIKPILLPICGPALLTGAYLLQKGRCRIEKATRSWREH